MLSFLQKTLQRINLKADTVYLWLLLALAILLCHDLLAGKLLGSGVDFESSFVRVVGLIQSWHEGLFLGRWLPDINAGYGYPLLNFYSPLFTYVAAGIGWILRDPVLGMNGALILAFFFSGVAMYFFAREFWGKDGAFLSAVAYMYCPYHIWDVFFRGACAEFFSCIFLPLTALALYKIYKNLDLGAVVFAMLSLAGLILSHNLMAFIFLWVLLLYGIFLCVLSAPDKRIKLLALGMAAMLGAVCLTAYFWLPLLGEKQFVSLWRTLQLVKYQCELFNIQQLLGHAWEVYPLKRPMPSFQLGLFHLLFALVPLFFWRRIKGASAKAGAHVVFWLAAAVFFGYFMTIHSGWIWQRVEGKIFIEFPWRFFLILNVVLCFIMGVGLLAVPLPLRRIVMTAGVIVLVIGNIGFAKPDSEMKTFNRTDWKSWIYQQNPRDGMEYLPVWVKKVTVASPKERFEIIKGQGRILSQDASPGPKMTALLQANTPALVIFHHFYFPGWVLYVDGKKTDIDHSNEYGLMVFFVSPGEHQIEVRFERTPVRMAGEAISIVAWLLMLATIFLVSFRKSKDVRTVTSV